VEVSGRQVTFVGFPAGKGPIKQAEGDWTMDDFDAALRERAKG
jgi:hypothetical protein